MPFNFADSHSLPYMKEIIHCFDKDYDDDCNLQMTLTFVDIPVIPDLEDQQDEDMSTKVAIAPK